MVRGGYIYIVCNSRNTTLYTGVTSDLLTSISEHKEKTDRNSFSARYNCNKLVYYESFENIEAAIEREKEIKGRSRKYKLDLIIQQNPMFSDLYDLLLKEWS